MFFEKQDKIGLFLGVHLRLIPVCIVIITDHHINI